MRKLFLGTGLVVFLAISNCPAQTTDLAELIGALYSPNGLTLPNPGHKAHFDPDFEASFGPLNRDLATQLSLLPLVSPASGFVYEFDRTLGVPVRAEGQSFGSILTERAETIGKNKYFVGFAYQRFDFKTIDGLDLNNFHTVYHHCVPSDSQCVAEPPDFARTGFRRDYITTNNKINLTINQYTPFFTLGVTNRLDISIAIPLLDVNLKVVSDATIHRIQPTGSLSNPELVQGEAHFFDLANPLTSIEKTFTQSGNASGIGDMVVRIKGTVWKGETAALAVVTDIRTPTGDPRNLLGSGTAGLKPFAAFSFHKHRFAPHANIGYEWNGDSILAGDLKTGVKKHLPNQFFYAAGTSIRAAKSVTVALDLLGQRVIDGQQVRPTTFTYQDSRDDLIVINNPDIRFVTSSFNIANGAVGVKFSPVGNLLVTANALFKLNDAGLRSKVVPLVGVSYIF